MSLYDMQKGFERFWFEKKNYLENESKKGMRYGGKCHLPDRKKMALSSVEATKEGQKQTG